MFFIYTVYATAAYNCFSEEDMSEMCPVDERFALTFSKHGPVGNLSDDDSGDHH